VPGTAVLIKATAQFEGETVRLTAQSVKGLDVLAAQTAAGLKIVITDDKPLADLQNTFQDAKRGRGKVTIVTRTPAREVHINLPASQHVAVTPELLHQVYAIAGIAEVLEI